MIRTLSALTVLATTTAGALAPSGPAPQKPPSFGDGRNSKFPYKFPYSARLTECANAGPTGALQQA